MQLVRRTPHGVRGLKYGGGRARERDFGRTPHGVRGLKSAYASPQQMVLLSHPSRGAWIEIVKLVHLYDIP